MKDDMRGILWGTVFNVTEPTKTWNAVLIKLILEELGGLWCEYFEPNPNWERVYMYVRDDSMRIVVNHYEEDDLEDQYIRKTCGGFKYEATNGIPSGFIVGGLNDWTICSRWLCSDAAKKGFLRNPTEEPMPTYMDTQSIDSIFHGFVYGITSYAKWYSKHYEQEMLVDISMVKFAFSNPSSHQVYFLETAVTESTELITIRLGIFGGDIECDMSRYEYTYRIDMPRWNNGEVDVDYDVRSVRDIHPHITPAKRYYSFMDTPVHILTVANPNHNAVTYSYITDKVKEWAEARGISGYHYLKTTPYPIYINEHKSKQENKSVKPKNNTKMAETKKSSFMEKMMARFKGQFVPEKCDEFAITYDGNLVAKCKAGSEIIYNTIVDGAVVSYPEEAVWNIPMFTILRPAEKICVNDIICISGPTTASRFGKVTEIQRTGAGVKSFKVIRFNGTEDGSVVTKDAIMKQGLVETIFNPFDPNSNNIFEGFNIPGMSGNNPMMGIMMMKVLTGDKSNSDDLIEKMCLMGVMSGNNMLMGNSNPMMGIMMMKMFAGGDGDSEDLMKMYFMSAMMNGNNPFTNMFQQAQPEQPTRKVRSDKGTKKTKPVETPEEDAPGDNPQDNE